VASIGLMSMSFIADSLSAIVSASSTFILEITDGFHRGVRLELEPGDYRIGSTPGADIVLRDAGIAAEHAVLRVGRRSIDLHAIGGEVGVGEEVIAKGYGCALRPPIDLTIGEARLRISVERSQAPARPVERGQAPARPVESGQAPARPRISVAILIAGGLLLAVPALGLAAKRQVAPATYDVTAEAPSDLFDKFDKFNNRKRGEGRETPPPTTASPQQPRPNPGSANTAEEAGRKLSEVLQVSGLSGLRVNASGGQVVVAGSIMKQQSAAWTEAQQWFDGAYRGKLVLVSNVTFGEAKPMPVVNVQAVWFGERPYIITAEGSRYYKGSFLDNGWTIKDIADGRILLAKDGETLALVYRQ
jgi:Inner membrane component of T3SS, cytoplasmic domain/YscD/CdsD-like Bon-like domain 3